MPTPISAERRSLKKCQGQGWACTICPATHRGQAFFPNLKAALNHERSVHGCDLPGMKNDKNTSETDEICIPENYLQTADETCWDKIGQPRLTSEGLRQWEMHAHVDHVFDLVPFWQRGIDAAEKGEVLRLEEFLEKMEGDGGWRTANEVLGMLGEWKESPSERARRWGGDDWVASQGGGWDAASGRIASDATEPSGKRDGGCGIREARGTGFKTGRRGRGGAVRDGWGAGARVKTVRAVGSGGREELHHFVDAVAQQEAVNEERREQMHLFFDMPVEQKIQKIEETIRFLRTHAA